MMLIANAAKSQNYLDGQVKWLSAALTMSKEDKNLNRKIR